jgi:predicted glycosyltransferase
VNLWIDLANSPQVLFFRPLIAELLRRGHRITLTSRDFAQTVPLADKLGLAHTPIGGHGGRRWSNILQATLLRARELVKWARARPAFDLAVSFNSYGQAIAAARLHLPYVTLMDYEHQPANHLCFRLARRVIVPECFPENSLARFGARYKTLKYDGIKEQIYLADFVPQPNYLQALGIDTTRPVIVMRPPAPWAAYHRNFKDTLFDEVMEHTLRQNVTVIFTPRIPEQADQARSLAKTNLWIPPQVLDGPNLLYHADMVISGGATMNREAGVLGTPAVTVFKGVLAAVDEYLIRRGRMIQITDRAELDSLLFEKKTSPNVSIDAQLVNQVADMILDSRARA